MNFKNNIFVSAVAMIDVDSRILISNRKNRKQFSNYWEFPGGKIENNETPEACLIRELKEEINVDVSKSCIAPIGFSTSSYSEFDITLLLYICRKWIGTPIALEGNDIKWIAPKDLKLHKMPEANSSLIPILLDLV
jgi:8-oxo-dGTP diphosphatase